MLKKPNFKGQYYRHWLLIHQINHVNFLIHIMVYKTCKLAIPALKITRIATTIL